MPAVLYTAGAVAISIVDSSFAVSVDGLVDAQKIDMEAAAVQYVQTTATAMPVKTIAGKSAKKRSNKNNKTSAGQSSGGVGIGASFALANLNTRVSVNTSANILKREIKAKSNFTNRVTQQLNPGMTLSTMMAETRQVNQDHSNLNSKYNKIALDAVAISIMDITVEAVIGAPANPEVSI